MPGGSSLDRTPSVDVMKLYFCPLVARTFQPNGFLPIYEPLVNARRQGRIYRSERRVRTLGRAEVRVEDDSFIWSAYAVGRGLFIDNCDAALALTKPVLF